MLNFASTIFLLLTVLAFSPVSADAPKERIALLLTGPRCREARHTLETTLRHTDGVFAVDGTSVPDHLLVDIEEGKTSAQDLLMAIQTAGNNTLSCQVEIMRSCVTAPKLAGAAAPAK